MAFPGPYSHARPGWHWGPPGAGGAPLHVYFVPPSVGIASCERDLVQQLDVLGELPPGHPADPAVAVWAEPRQAIEVVERDLGEQRGRQGPAVA